MQSIACRCATKKSRSTLWRRASPGAWSVKEPRTKKKRRPLSIYAEEASCPLSSLTFFIVGSISPCSSKQASSAVTKPELRGSPAPPSIIPPTSKIKKVGKRKSIEATGEGGREGRGEA